MFYSEGLLTLSNSQVLVTTY